MNQKHFLFFLIFLFIIPLFIGCTQKYTGDDFTFTTLSGDVQTLEDYQGTVVVIDFMATWCSPCINEMKELAKIRDHYTTDNVTIISLSVEDTDTPSKIRSTFGAYVNQWIFGTDDYDLFVTKYSINNGIPTIYIFDDKGSVAYYHEGLTYAASLIEQIDKLQ